MTENCEKRAAWIWYPGDYEALLFCKCMAERRERDVLITPFWRMDSHYVSVKFYADFTLSEPDEITVKVDGDFNIFIEGMGYIKNFGGKLRLPAGTYEMQILVTNVSELPCIYVCGNQIKSGSHSFRVTCQDHVFMPAAQGEFFDINGSPNRRVKKTRETKPVSEEDINGGKLYDFGKEISAYLKLYETKDAETEIFYGESREEALDTEHSEQTDCVVTREGESFVTPVTKAFRWAFVPRSGGYRKLTALEEVFGKENKGRFNSSDKLLQKIYDVSVYTLGMCKKEFFLDGAKRDRWSWSGDAYQSYLVNYYTFCDSDAVKRTVRALKGKEPIKTHINHIMDYTMYWILSLYDYYLYTGDKEFLAEMFCGAEGYVKFLLSRTNADGFLQNYPEDWVFIDWAKIDNRGETSSEQILFSIALKRFSAICEELGKDGSFYADKAKEVLSRTLEVFWVDGRFVHRRGNGVLDLTVTRYANMFAVLFDLLDEEKRKSVIEKVLLNDEVQKITTPYMQFYEQATLAAIGMPEKVLSGMKAYWGGMLGEGATTFWEAYNPEEKGAAKYAMYGRPYGKSLCHAWGANPVYLIFNCLLGIRPNEAGYKTFVCSPRLNVLPDFDCAAPVGKGKLFLKYDEKTFTVHAENCAGYVEVPDCFVPAPDNGSRAAQMWKCGGKYFLEASEKITFEKREVEYVV